MISEGYGIDQITLLTLLIRTDRHEQTMQTQIRRDTMLRLIRVYTVCHSSDASG